MDLLDPPTPDMTMPKREDTVPALLVETAPAPRVSAPAPDGTDGTGWTVVQAGAFCMVVDFG